MKTEAVAASRDSRRPAGATNGDSAFIQQSKIIIQQFLINGGSGGLR
jgi:hypothetical protein